ncbi:MAG: hypothetical protein JXR59_01970 [Desulfuromonadaceae bacterium]|nr:hypothetical protein [Desulfuromonadaceae bacterium]
MPKYFIVTTYGRTASHWLTKVLNTHAEIVCNHGCFGGRVAPLVAVGTQVSEEYNLDAIRTEAEAVWRQSSLDDIFDRLEKEFSAKYYGNIHGFSWSFLNDKLANERVGRKINIVNVVRHPINRIISSLNEWEKEERVSKETTRFFDGEFDRFYSIYNKFLDDEIDFTDVYSRRLFFAITHTVIQDSVDLFKGGMHLPMERLTVDREFFLYFLNHITEGCLTNPEDFVCKVMGVGKTNSSRSKNNLSLTSYNELPRWAKSLLINMLTDLEKTYSVIDSYSALGYDLSCCLGTGFTRSRPCYESRFKETLLELNAVKNENKKNFEKFMVRAIRNFLRFGYVEGEKIILYGSGYHTEVFLKEYVNLYRNLENLTIVVDSENDRNKFKIKTILDKDLNASVTTKIVISSYSYEEDIYRKLLGRSFSPENIVKIYG